MKTRAWTMWLVGALSGLVIGCGPSESGAGTPDPIDGACAEATTQCSGNTFQTCAGGEWATTEQCSAVCEPNLGCVACRPSQSFCVANDIHMCDGQGNDGGYLQSCESGENCSGGRCANLCEEAERSSSYIGCEYYAVDLDNAIEVYTPSNAATDEPTANCTGERPNSGRSVPSGTVPRNDLSVCYSPDPGDDRDLLAGLCEGTGECPNDYTCAVRPACIYDAQHSPFAIVVSNPQTFSVDITIEDASGHSQQVALAAGAVQSLFPQQMGFADQSINGSGKTLAAYRLTSNAPVVAYQFNPLNNVDVFSNDGSLLIPRTTWDTAYYAMTWPTLDRRANSNTNDYNGYVAVVAWQDGTSVRVTPTANIRASATQPAIAARTSQTFELNAFEVLHLESAPGQQDLTGTRIEAVDGVATFGVFSGHEAISLPIDPPDPFASGSCCSDHVEEMMFPASTWGTEFVVARSQDRGQGETDVLRILAQKAGTSVSFNPAPVAGSCNILGPGQFCQVEIMVDTEVVANDEHPILIGHYLKSVIWRDFFGTRHGNGDPSLSLAVPFEQFRSSYSFLVPQEYDVQFISVAAKAGASVVLNGAEIGGTLKTFGKGSHGAGRIKVNPGQHLLECTGGCGLEVYGYSDAVSYLFAGGLDLRKIVVD